MSETSQTAAPARGTLSVIRQADCKNCHQPIEQSASTGFEWAHVDTGRSSCH